VYDDQDDDGERDGGESVATVPPVTRTRDRSDGTCTVYADLDDDGEPEPSEPQLRTVCPDPSTESEQTPVPFGTGNVTVYDDENDNGIADEGEPILHVAPRERVAEIGTVDASGPTITLQEGALSASVEKTFANLPLIVPSGAGFNPDSLDRSVGPVTTEYRGTGTACAADTCQFTLTQNVDEAEKIAEVWEANVTLSADGDEVTTVQVPVPIVDDPRPELNRLG